MKQNNKCSPFGVIAGAVVAAAALALMIALTACSSPTGGGGGGDGGGNTTVKIPDELVGGWVTKETIGQTYLFHITSGGVFRVPGHSDKDFDKVSVSGKTVTIKAGGVTLGTFDYGIRNNEMAVTNPTGIFAFIADIVPPTLEKADPDSAYPIRGGSYLAVTNWPAMIYDVLITTAAINASSSYNELAQDAAHKKAEKKQVHSPLYFSHDVLIGNFNVFIIGEEMGVGVPDPEDIPSPPIKIIKYQNGVTFNVRHDAAINWDAMITGGQP